ncbi:MAG: ABC transporter permease [Caulobacteraceae bacterium]|nr:ABC transporter permease [Caulobacteraceae bacterium]
MRLASLWSLFRKELASLWRDPAALVIIAFCFSVAVYSVSQDIKAEVEDAPVGIVDHDRSALSFRIRDAIQPPMFQAPVELTPDAVAPAMDEGRVIFVLDIPPGFEADVLRGRRPAVQLLVDATAMSQAGLGASDIQQVIAQESAAFLNRPGLEALAPVRLAPRTAFNPNQKAMWFIAITQIVMNLTILSIVLVGAAFMRERERGTMDHLLVMPVSAVEVAMSKILANGAVVALAAWLSLELVIKRSLGVPIQGSIGLFMACVAPYLFATTAIGILLATAADSMPQFALISIPVFVVLVMLSGAVTPIESMPHLMRTIMQASPTTHFVALSEAVLFRGGGLAEIWGHLVVISIIGAIALTAALMRFRAMMAKAT